MVLENNEVLSLVCCTLGQRPDELSLFLRTVARARQQQSLQLVLVDQSADGLWCSSIAPDLFAQVDVHIRSRRGASYGRNLGLLEANGTIVAFPDDDCWYERGTLEQVVTHLAERPHLDGVVTHLRDENGDSMNLRWPRKAIDELCLRMVARVASNVTMFIRLRALRGVRYDESIGPGTEPYPAGEDMLFLAELVRAGAHISYIPEIAVSHPNVLNGSILTVGARRYGRGYGRVARMARMGPRVYAPALLRPLVGSLIGRKEERRFRRQVFIGRLEGLTGRVDNSYGNSC